MWITSPWGIPSIAGDRCQGVMNFSPLQSGKRFENHIVETAEVTSEASCQIRCFMNLEICRSINFNHTESSKGHFCELNNSTAKEHPTDLKNRPEFDYHETKVWRRIKARLHMWFFLQFRMRFRVQNTIYPTLHECFHREASRELERIITYYLKTPLFRALRD